METKTNLRKKYLEIRNKLPKELQARKSHLIFQRLTEEHKFKDAENILLYCNYGSEVDTKEIFDYALANKKKVFFPKVQGMTMGFYEVNAISELSMGYKGILEPLEQALSYEEQQQNCNKTCIIVPGSVFGKNGYRIGYGKGFYDRFLAENPEIFSVGICFEEQIVENCPFEENDIPLQIIITEQERYVFI